VPTPTQPAEQFYSYSLFGYTSSRANVRLEGIKLLEGTKAREDGYFEFIGFMASSLNREFCLTTIDTENLIAPPLCIPVPVPQPQVRYGPYLLPPTLRLSKGEVNTGEITTVQGKTIPGSTVNLHVFNRTEQTLAKGLIKTAFAAESGRPMTIKLTAAIDGSYSTRIESNQPGKKRVFSQSVFLTNSGDSQTPKSVTLTINIFNALMAYLIFFFGLILKFLNLNVLLFIQAVIIIMVLLKRKRIFSWYHLQLRKSQAIVLYHSPGLARREHNYTPLNRI